MASGETPAGKAGEHITIAIFDERVGWVLPEQHIARIRAAADPAVPVTVVSSGAELLRVLPRTTQLIGQPITADQLASIGERLRCIHLTASLGDATDTLLAALSRGVRVASAASIRAPFIAEHAVALALALTRRLDEAAAARTEHRWATADLAPKLRTLNGSTVVLVAASAVLHELAQRFKAFGCHIEAVSVLHDAESVLVDEHVGLERLDHALAEADLLVIACPDIPATSGLFNRKRIARLPRTAYIVDVSRGSVVEQTALLEALRRRRIAGAGIDAFDVQPLPPESPFWTMPNVIITPGIAAASPTYWLHAVDIISRNIRRYAEGRRLIDELSPASYDIKAPAKATPAPAAADS